MATHANAAHHAVAPGGFIRKYIFSVDHKVIGIQYICLAILSVFVGMALSILMRIHLVWPDAKIPFLEGGQMTPEAYLALVTMHGSIMVFMVLTTAPQSGFGNYFLPIQIGAADMAFPVLNMLSFWTTFLSLIVLVAAFFVTGGAPIGGWTAYPPLSALGQIVGPGQGTGQTLWVLGVAIFCGASLMGAHQLHYHAHRPARQGHDADAHAADAVVVVRHRHIWPAGVRRVARGLHSPAARSRGRHELLHSRRPGGQRHQR